MATKTRRLLTFLLTLAFIAPGTVMAQQTRSVDDWHFSAQAYLWYASIGGSSASDGEIDIDAGDLIDALDFAFMGTLRAEKQRWSLMADIVFLEVSDDDDIATGVNAEVELQSWIVTPAVGYTVLETDGARLDVLAGARYLWLKSDVAIELTSPLPAAKRTVSDSGDVWDGIVGLRGQVNLPQNFFLPYYLDIGTGNSDLTWQVFAGIGYTLDRVDLILGYRYLQWEFDDNSVFDDMDVSGPVAGITFVF